MELVSFLSSSSFLSPEHVGQPYSWVGHIPFAFWIVEASRPNVLVELGTHSGNSYFSFCQAVKRHNLPTLCHAVDSWQGDEHAGFYGEDVFQAVVEHNRLVYDSFSRLIRSRFDEAQVRFDDGSIDLLHIDGLHTYEAVKHDFEMWLPKMSRRGIVLLHDTNVHERDFGVYLLFQELAEQYPAFEFLHSHGLGVIGVGADLPESVRNLFQACGDESSRDTVRTCYQRLAQVILEQCTRADLETLTNSVRGELDRMHENLVSAQGRIVALEARHLETLKGQQLLQEAERQQNNNNLTAARTALALAENQIERQVSQIETLKKRQFTLEAERQSANDEIAKLCDKLLAHLGQIDEQRNQMDQQRRQIDEQRNQMDQQRRQIDEQRNQMDQQHRQIDEQRRQIDERRNQMDEQHRQIDEQRRQIHEIQQSLGWMLLNRARAARSRLIRDDSGCGRLWTGLTRSFKSEGDSVTRPR